jgi:GTP-binding protein YchF
MKTAITGLSNSGKTTVFNALTGMEVETTPYPTAAGEPNMGVVKVPDPRLDVLTKILNPKKTTHSTVQYVDYAGITKGDPKHNRSVFEFIKDADSLVHVVRAFGDDSVMHPMGPLVDPVRDAGVLEDELLLGDLELVEKRLAALELSRKKGTETDGLEKKVLEMCAGALGDGIPLRDVEFRGDELRAVRHIQFMSVKPEVVVVNTGEDDLNKERASALLMDVEGYYSGRSRITALALSAKVEMEIAQMDPADAGEFLADLGIGEPALRRLIRVSYGNLGLITFFTIVSDEVRAWAIRRGSDALTAAGKVHTDIQRGFIRAETVAYDDFVALDGMAGARDKGLLRLEGKGYKVRDGDIINFRFNV